MSRRARSAGAATQTSRRSTRTVGQYVFGKVMGEGTFGKVNLATHIPTGEKVAIKVLQKSKIKDQADARRVRREIKILKRANHQNVIQLYEVLETPHAIYLIMEYADGGEMFDYIVTHRRVPEQQACKFFHQLVDGVESLHRCEVTHRDLKPENLLLKSSPSGWVLKIVDFGLSNIHDGGRLLGTACGSPCYAAPEMIAGKQYAGPKADIWSMGVILFALICGYLPFEDASTHALYRKILSGDYKIPSIVSPSGRDLIKRILNTDPNTRYSIPKIRQHLWYRQIEDDTVPTEYLHITCDSVMDRIHEAALRASHELGVGRKAVLEGLANKQFNSATASYFLLRNKLCREHIVAETQRAAAEAEAELQAMKQSAELAPNIITELPVMEKGIIAEVQPEEAEPTEKPVAVVPSPPKDATGRKHADDAPTVSLKVPKSPQTAVSATLAATNETNVAPSVEPSKRETVTQTQTQTQTQTDHVPPVEQTPLSHDAEPAVDTASPKHQQPTEPPQQLQPASTEPVSPVPAENVSEVIREAVAQQQDIEPAATTADNVERAATTPAAPPSQTAEEPTDKGSEYVAAAMISPRREAPIIPVTPPARVNGFSTPSTTTVPRLRLQQLHQAYKAFVSGSAQKKQRSPAAPTRSTTTRSPAPRIMGLRPTARAQETIMTAVVSNAPLAPRTPPANRRPTVKRPTMQDRTAAANKPTIPSAQHEPTAPTTPTTSSPSTAVADSAVGPKPPEQPMSSRVKNMNATTLHGRRIVSAGRTSKPQRPPVAPSIPVTTGHS